MARLVFRSLVLLRLLSSGVSVCVGICPSGRRSRLHIVWRLRRTTARVAKTSIEQAQRDIRKAKEDAGEKHASTCFAISEAGEWVATPEAVAQCIADCA